jgi:hypothetical protein
MAWKILGILVAVAGAIAAVGGSVLSLRRQHRDF